LDLNDSPICSNVESLPVQVGVDSEDGEIVLETTSQIRVLENDDDRMVNDTIVSETAELTETIKIGKQVGMNLEGFEVQILEELRAEKEINVDPLII
jgi:hypothetical protein